MQNEAIIAMATNNYKRPDKRLCVSPMKLKPSLKDSLCYSESIYVSLKQAYTLALLGGIHE